jgi:hypothetical protein
MQEAAMTDKIPSISSCATFSAAQIEEEWPVRLQQIGREITERLRKAHKQREVADNHLVAVKELIAEAKELVAGPTAPADCKLKATNIASEQAPEPTKSRCSVSPGDKALVGFSSVVCGLVQITRHNKAERFAKTSVRADHLARLGIFLTDFAGLKMSEADVPVLPGNGTGAAPQQSPESMKVERRARDAEKKYV